MEDLCRVQFTTTSGDQYSFDGMFIVREGSATVYQVTGKFECSSLFVHSDPERAGPCVILWRRFENKRADSSRNLPVEENMWARVFPGAHHLIEFLETQVDDPTSEARDSVAYPRLLERIEGFIAEGEP